MTSPSSPHLRTRLSPIDEIALTRHRSAWRPQLDGEVDESWIWADFIQGRGTDFGWGGGRSTLHYALWGADELQGLLVLSRPYICQARQQSGLPGLYLEYLATAPWNRPNISVATGDHPRMKGVGTRLFTIAVQKSMEFQWEGRVGWTSTENALNWYVGVILDACGQEPILIGHHPETEEKQFEITSVMASRWVAKIKSAAESDQ